MKPFKAHIDEFQLVARLKEQDKSALAYLYDHYSAALYGTILRMVKQRGIAEEILQDTFLKIWNNIDRYSASRGRLFTWMFNVARNLAIDKLRSREIRQTLKTVAVADHQDYIDNKNHHQQQTDSIGIDRLLKKLQPEQFLIINLLYFHGFTQAQVATEYQIPLGTVKTRHRTAMINLRRLLAGEL